MRAVAPLSLPSAPSDGELVVRAQNGDAWAYETLYRRHVHRVTRVVARLLRHGPDIEDVVQDAFTTGFADLGSLREPDSVGRWLVGIAVHEAHRRFRRRKLMRMLGLDRSVDDERLVHQLAQHAGAEARLIASRVDEVLDEMRTDERTCFVLRHLEGHALEEVATISGLSLSTVKRRLASARNRMTARGLGEVLDG